MLGCASWERDQLHGEWRQNWWYAVTAEATETVETVEAVGASIGSGVASGAMAAADALGLGGLEGEP